MPAVTADLEETTLLALKAVHNTVIVGYLTLDHHVVQEWFTTIAEDMRDHFVFCMSDIPSFRLAAVEEVKAPSIVVYKHVAEEKSVIRDLSSQETIRGSIVRAARPLVTDFLPELHDDMLNVGVPPRRLCHTVLTVS